MKPRRTDRDGFWFPAKTYGWGWGPPIAWQGWVALGAYVLFVTAWSVRFIPTRSPWLFVSGILAASAVLVLACWLKGEPPRWRWGDGPDDRPARRP